MPVPYSVWLIICRWVSPGMPCMWLNLWMPPNLHICGFKSACQPWSQQVSLFGLKFNWEAVVLSHAVNDWCSRVQGFEEGWRSLKCLTFSPPLSPYALAKQGNPHIYWWVKSLRLLRVDCYTCTSCSKLNQCLSERSIKSGLGQKEGRQCVWKGKLYSSNGHQTAPHREDNLINS